MTDPKPATRPKILIVDDVAANRLSLRRLLAKVDAELVEADSGNTALAASLDHRFALILLDVNMPEMDGFEVASLLREDPQSRETPIIFISAAYDDMNRLRGYDSGAVDYIAKPVNDVVLLSKVRVFLELYQRRAELQAALTRQSMFSDALHQEVKLRQAAEKQVWHRASHDPLTDLPNRMLFMDRLQHAIERSGRHARAFALGYVDIDGFKPVNDTHGHPAGDELLKQIAARLLAQVRKEDTVARLGGDEFAVILEEVIDTPASAERIGAGICAALRRPFAISTEHGEITVTVGASVGMALFPDHARDRESLIRVADQAMYVAKRGGKNRVVIAGV